MWNNLKDFESTDALQYTWSKSVHNRKLLAAINIDTRNIVSVLMMRDEWLKINFVVESHLCH